MYQDELESSFIPKNKIFALHGHGQPNPVFFAINNHTCHSSIFMNSTEDGKPWKISLTPFFRIFLYVHLFACLITQQYGVAFYYHIIISKISNILFRLFTFSIRRYLIFWRCSSRRMSESHHVKSSDISVIILLLGNCVFRYVK